jgi:hypothetical protein
MIHFKLIFRYKRPAFKIRFKKGSSASQSNLNHVSPLEIRHFPKIEAHNDTRKRKPKVSAALTDAPVKVALEAEVEARSEPIKHNGLFS